MFVLREVEDESLVELEIHFGFQCGLHTGTVKVDFPAAGAYRPLVRG